MGQLESFYCQDLLAFITAGERALLFDDGVTSGDPHVTIHLLLMRGLAKQFQGFFKKFKSPKRIAQWFKWPISNIFCTLIDLSAG